MSHANGQVKFQDGLVLHYEYDGTSDIVLPALYKTWEEMHENWRNQPWKQCSCGKDEPVELATDYAFGYSWAGRACRHCMAVTDGIGVYDINEYIVDDLLPEWWQYQRGGTNEMG